MLPGLSSLLPSLPDYVELHCISNFTFLDGASHPQELIARAFQLGYSGLALTDECSVAGTRARITPSRRCARNGKPSRAARGVWRQGRRRGERRGG
jgi:hypothetical protein